MRTIYLDDNASTPLAAEVAAVMHRALETAHGNPSSDPWAVDHMIGSRTSIGAALLGLTATKPETAGEPPRIAGRTAANGARLELRRKDRGMHDRSKSDWLAPAPAALTLVACYGTLAAIGLLGALGITIALNQAVWAGAIALLAGATCVALLIRRCEHGRTAPLALPGLGFAFLGAGTLLDRRIGRGRRDTSL